MKTQQTGAATAHTQAATQRERESKTRARRLCDDFRLTWAVHYEKIAAKRNRFQKGENNATVLLWGTNTPLIDGQPALHRETEGRTSARGKLDSFKLGATDESNRAVAE